MRTWLAALLAVACAASAAPAGEVAPAVLDEGSPFRAYYAWKAPVVRADSGPKEAAGLGEERITQLAQGVNTPLPPEGWAAPDFDDSSWGRWPGMALKADRQNKLEKYNYGVGSYPYRPFEDLASPCTALLCLRGRFEVTNPGPMALSLAYRGGVVVYVNGKEVARSHLPKDGKVALDALADDYPEEAHLGTDGKPFHFYSSGWAKVGGKERLPLRVRRLENAAIPAAALKAGVNVLAIEFHRSAHHSKRDAANWGTCGPVSIELRGGGAKPNSARPAGVQVWTSSIMVRTSPPDYADPLEPPRPLSIVAARNGVFDAKVVVSSDGPLKGVKATMSDLTRRGGAGSIPASAVKVLYCVRDDRNRMQYDVPMGFWDTLLEAPPAEIQPEKQGQELLGAIQPMVIKVRIPADASAGEYEGKLSVNAGTGAPVEVPVKLKVIDWKLPDPRDFETHMALIQSPESVALEYKVPLWSDQHWKLMEKSFELLGEVGNRYLCIPLICRTNFGNSESLVRWIKQPAGSYQHDFTVFDRYLDLAQKHLKLDVVVLYVWDLYAGKLSWGKDRVEGTGPKVSVLDPATGKVEELEAPKFESPEAKAFWEPVCREVRARLEKRGLLPAMMAGISAENRFPTKEAVATFQELLPGARWVFNGHPASGGAVHGMPVGYETRVYIGFPPPAAWDAKRKFAWQNPSRFDIFPRSGPSIGPLYPQRPLAQHHAYLEMALLSSSYGVNYNGLGRTGADFWAVLGSAGGTTGKRSATITGRYPESCWNQLNMNCATEALLAPGPGGATTTERFENLREGVQECEARICIERAIVGGRLDAALARKCQEVLDERARRFRAACAAEAWAWYAGSGSAGLAEELFSAAAEAVRERR